MRWSGTELSRRDGGWWGGGEVGGGGLKRYFLPGFISLAIAGEDKPFLKQLLNYLISFPRSLGNRADNSPWTLKKLIQACLLFSLLAVEKPANRLHRTWWSQPTTDTVTAKFSPFLLSFFFLFLFCFAFAFVFECGSHEHCRYTRARLVSVINNAATR